MKFILLQSNTMLIATTITIIIFILKCSSHDTSQELILTFYYIQWFIFLVLDDELK